MKPDNGRILRLRRSQGGDAHARAQELMPWLAGDRLAPDERAAVEAHIESCAECQADARLERQLRAQVAELPLDVDASWSRMRRRLEPRATRWNAVRGLAPWAGWAAAAALVVVVALPTLAPAPAPYHVLSASQTAPAADVVVMFHPQTTEPQFRAVLAEAGVRLVDGPTAAGGYLLRATPGGRDAALARLKADAHVSLAQPLGAVQ